MSIKPEELERIINHMNEDHGDSLVLYAHAYANRKDVQSAKMIELTANEIVLALESGEHLKIPLTSTLETAKDAHMVLVSMSKQARILLDDKDD